MREMLMFATLFMISTSTPCRLPAQLRSESITLRAFPGDTVRSDSSPRAGPRLDDLVAGLSLSREPPSSQDARDARKAVQMIRGGGGSNVAAYVFIGALMGAFVAAVAAYEIVQGSRCHRTGCVTDHSEDGLVYLYLIPAGLGLGAALGLIVGIATD